jgi:uncharacterized protein YecT (DUF1311 family)
MLIPLMMLVAAGGPPHNCPDQSQAGLDMCASNELQYADRIMNSLYRALRADMSPQEAQRFVLAQRAWLNWRDRECEMQTHGGFGAPGTITPMMMNECLRDMTRDRVDRFRDFTKCAPGDLSCPAD